MLPENENKFFIWAWSPYQANNHLYLITFGRRWEIPKRISVGISISRVRPDVLLQWPNPPRRRAVQVHAVESIHHKSYHDPPLQSRYTSSSLYSPWMHHLYFDSTTEDYKILLVYENCYTVYSCKNGSWDIKDFPREFNVLDYEASVDGCIYLRKGDEIIEYLEARDGKLHTFRQPDGVESLIEGELKKVSGRLSLTGLSEDHLIQMWVMEKNGSSEKCWRKVVSMGEEDAGLLDLSPVCLSDKDLVVLSSIYGSNYRKR